MTASQHRVLPAVPGKEQGLPGGNDTPVGESPGMIVGVLSDTHVPDRARCLPPALFETFNGVDLILHAGDIACQEVLSELETLAPVVAVAGNMDPPELQARLPRRQEVVVGGYRIGLIHGHQLRGPLAQGALRAFTGVDAVVFGHSHRPLLETRNGVLLLNPGSPTDRRRSPRCTCALLFPGPSGLRGELRELP